MSLPGKVQITTGARLHIGPLANAAETGRDFGGVGLMVSAPSCRVVVSTSESDTITAPDAIYDRVAKVRDQCRTSDAWKPCQIEVVESIPQHHGFGGGTQLSLAIATAMARLNQDDSNTFKLARRVGRGLRSGLGIHGFEYGGFLVDGGKSMPNSIGGLSARNNFPDEWTLLLISPGGSEGLSGEREVQAFRDLSPMSITDTSHLCRLVLMRMLPAISEQDFCEFADAVGEFGQRVGEYFSPAQGGVFSSQRMSDLADQLGREGIRGVAQTSWGPTIAAFFPTEQEAILKHSELTSDEVWADCSIIIATAMNRGAEVVEL